MATVSGTGRREPDVVDGALKVTIVEEPNVAGLSAIGRRRPDVVDGAMKVFVEGGISPTPTPTDTATKVLHIVADAVGQDLALAGTFADVPWRGVSYDTTDGDLTYASNEVTCVVAGAYKVALFGVVTFSGTYRSLFEILVDTGGGYARPSGCAIFCNGIDSQDHFNNPGVILELTAGDKVKVQARRLSGSGGVINASGNGSFWTFTRVGD